MGLRSGEAKELAGAAELLKATAHGAAHGAAAGGGPRQVVAAAAAAAARTVWALLGGSDAARAEEDLELATRQAAMEPATRQQMRGARPCSRDRALRNVCARVDLGKGVEVLQEALSRPQGAQRGEAAVISVQAAPDLGPLRGGGRRQAAPVGSGPQEGDGSGCSLSTVGSEQELEDVLKGRAAQPRAVRARRSGELRDVDGHGDAEQRRRRGVNWGDGGSEGSVQSVKIGRQALPAQRAVACVLATQLRLIGSTVSSSSAFLSLGGCVKNAARVVEMLEKGFGVTLPSSAESDLLLARAGWQTAQDIADQVQRRVDLSTRRSPAACAAVAMARSPCSGGSGRRCKSYWMCSCGEWNWDWRTSCLGCGHAAPPWATGAARGAASRAASTKSQTSASAASGTPSGGGAAAIERLQAAVEQLEALQAEPPDGVDSCFTDIVVSQLEAKRAELVKANAISKGEKRLRAARQELEQKQEARDLVEAQLHQAQEKLTELDGELEEASLALQALEEAAREEAEAMRRQRAAERTGASQVPGLLMQLEKLPEAWSTSNFEVAWAAIRAQMEAVRAQLEGAPLASKRTPWAESCPMEEISSHVGGLADGGGVWQPQPAAERGQAERCGKALGEWPTLAQACKRELAAEAADLAPLAAHPAGKVVESGWAGLRGMGALVPPWGQERAAGPSGVRILLSTGENVVGGVGFGASEWIEPVGRAGAPEPPEAMARSAGPQLPTVQPLRARAQRREEAAARGGVAATGVSHASAVRDVVQAQWIGNWHLESERYTVMDLGGTSNPMFLEPRPWPGVEGNATQRRARGGGDGELDSEQYVNGWAASIGGFLPAEGNNLVTSAAASEALQDSRSTGSSAAALSATAVAFSVLGHVLSYACVGEGEDTQEIAACTKCGAHKVLGGHAGGRSRLKMQCPGPSNLTNKSRDQRSLWERGLHPGGRPREDRQRARAEGIPALRSQGPVPGHAQERYLEWIGMEAEPTGGASTAASRSGSGPTAPEAGRYVVEPAAASLPQQRPGPSAGPHGAGGAVVGEPAAAEPAPSDGLVGRRVCRRLARRGSESSGSD
ncbi:unnamed protein product [Prorocentrum cordatum]|uniref:RanBP2-type domain-containing protein n=1 Tax=Prorocentrum cordatum TaxID=2364126 RepID=A0ABN9U558_9DINO|nr:unnamed protein product [Polarella glacialis]